MTIAFSNAGMRGVYGALVWSALTACNASGPPLPGSPGYESASALAAREAGTGSAGTSPAPAPEQTPPITPEGAPGAAAGPFGEGPDDSTGSDTPIDVGAGGTVETPSGPDPATPPDEEEVTPGFRSGPSPGCDNGAVPAVSGRGTLTVSSGERSYVLHVPSGGSGPRPLVLAMHGYTLNATEHERTTGLSELADREGFVVVYPEGIGVPTSWNAGICCSYDDKSRDDLAFLAELIDHLGESTCLDQGRVYATGFSNGGMLTYRMACEMSDRIAAVASVAGSMVLPEDQCQPVRPVPLMHTHGTADPIVPFDGGSGPAWLTPAGETPATFPSAADEVALFAALNGCSSDTESVFSERDTECIRHSNCTDNAAVMLCTVDGGGHAWPGGADPGLLLSLIMGQQSQTLPTSQVMWDFLKEHHLP
jgi:polyhydroxybutyrate depolymerase